MMLIFVNRIFALTPASVRCVLSGVLAILLADEIQIIPPAHAAGDYIGTTTPINLCDYSGPSFDQVNALLHDRIRPGDHVNKLRDAVSATPEFKFGEPKIGKFLNFTGNLMDGTFEWGEPDFIENGLKRKAGAICHKGNGNIDLWSILIHTDTNHRLIEFQLSLFYIDEAFLARNEPLNANRFIDIGYESRELEKAVLAIWQAQNPTASALFAMLDDAGFIDINDNDFWTSMIFREPGIPEMPNGSALQIYRQALGKDGTSFAQDSLFFRFGWWIADGQPYIFITYNPETDAIISISADEPSMSE